jgi:hypothetical protein
MNGNRSKSRIEVLLILLVEGLLLKSQRNYSENRRDPFAARHFSVTCQALRAAMGLGLRGGSGDDLLLRRNKYR